MEELWRDVKYAVRLYRREFGFSLIVIFVLALGIGANTAIFAVVDTVLLRSLPFDHPERIAWIWGKWPGGEQASVSPPDLEDYQKKSHSFQQLGAFANAVVPFNLNVGGDPERVNGYYITANFFDALGIKPAFGRLFLAEEQQQGHDRVVLLNHSLWQQRFSGDKTIVGRTVEINGEEYLVAGVMPAGIDFPQKADVWVPLPAYLPDMKMRRAHSLRPVGRLNPGFTFSRAQAEMDLIASELQREYPDSNTGWSLKLVPLRDKMVGDIRPVLALMMGATLFVLLIACANVAHLMLVRANARKAEMSIRIAFGASRTSLVKQLIVEGLLLSLVGSVLGVALAYWGVGVLGSMIPSDIPRIHEATVNLSVLGFALFLSILTGLVCGLVPAIQASRAEVSEVLKERGRSGTESRGRNRTRSIFVVGEVALALMLCIGAGLMVRSLVRLQSVDPGFSTTNVLTMEISLPPLRYAEPAKRVGFLQTLTQKVESLPGVQAAGMISDLPLTGGGNDTYFTVKGRPPASDNEKLVANIRLVAENYFPAMGISLLQGRYFKQSEELGAPVVIINNAMAKKYFPAGNAVGGHLVIDIGEPLDAEIVGVIADIRQFSLEVESLDEMYIPMIIMPSTTVVVRSSVDPMSLVNPIRREVRAIDSQQPIANVKTMEQVLAGSMMGLNFRVVLLTIFAVIAFVLAVAGVYGMMSYSVSQQAGSLGIRMALGAQASDVLRLVLGQGMKLTLLGLGLGLVGALALHGLVSSFLFGVSATDWRTFATTALALALVALLACYLPARRAAKLDPATTLRQE